MCIRLLSLDGALLQPPAAEDRAALQRELVASAQGLARAPALPGPLTDLRLPGGHVDALRMLWVQVSPAPCPAPHAEGQHALTLCRQFAFRWTCEEMGGD